MGFVTPTFQMLCQKAHNWCWAAVAAAVHKYPKAPLPIDQCKEATRLLKPLNCCNDQPPCDIPMSLQQALGASLFEFVDGQITFEALQSEIDGANRAVCARVVWDLNGAKDGAHFVVINGCTLRSGVPHVSVLDPDGGDLGEADVMSTSHEMPFEMFRTKYRLYGVWHQTYRLV